MQTLRSALLPCEHLVAQIISEKTGIPVSELLPDTKRAPVRPVDAKVFLK